MISHVKPYYPDLPVFEDVDKYHMMFDEVLDDEVYSTYVNDLEGLSLLASPSRTCKSIINLLPGELYLKSKGYAIESAYEYGSKNMTTQFIEEMERRWELLQGLEHALRVSGGKELADIILKCCYARKWNDFILYNTDDRLLNDIILNDPSLKTLLYKKSYEVLKSSVLCILPTEQDNTDIIDRVDAIMIATDGIKHSKNYLRRIQKMDEEGKDAVKKVFSLRIESKSLRESGIIGSTILKIPGNEKFAFLLGMLGSKNVSELFDNKMCWQTLLEMPTEKALAISQIYAEQFYEGIKNIFSKFIQLKTQGKDEFVLTETPFESEHDFCKQSREKYLKFQKSIAESTKPVTKLAIKNLTATYLEYLYDAVVNNSTTDISQINPSERDYLCVVTYLFNKRTVVEIRNYFSHLETVALVPCFAVVLTILNQFSSAYDAYSRIDENSWKTALGQIMFRYMNIATLTKEERDIRYAILNQNTQTNEYFIGKFIPVKPDQYPVYSEKMLALVSFADELIQLLSFNGVDVSWIHLDKERTKSSLPEPDSISIVDASSTQETPKAMPKESISELVENEYLSKILLSSSDIHPESYSGENPPTIRECIGEIKFIIETKKDSQNKLDYLRAKHLCRWIYLKSMDEDGFSRDLLLKILQLVTEEDSISKPQWDSIYSRIIEYFENITSLQQLSRYAEHDLPFLKNVSIIANAKVKLLSITDKKIWSNIISTISQVAGFSETQASEADQLHKLLGIRSKLNVYSSSNSLFSIINTKLTLLLSNQITLFRHSPEISIEIVDEKEGFSQSIVWEDSNDIGTMYAIISNVGGDDALDVKLISSINMSREKTFSIKKIYSGEKIPFKETFFINDIRNGKVTWDITITYFDVEKSKTVTCMHETTANINMGGTPLNLGYINTGNPADSNNFVGRSRELAILKNHYSQIQQLPSMLIRGLKRSGKSSLLAKFYEKIRSGDKIITCIIDAQSIGRNLKSAFVDKVLDGIRFGYQRHPRYKTLFEEQFYTFKDAWIARLETDDWISQLDAFYFELSQFMHGKLLLIYDEMESIFYNHQFESVEQEESLYAALRALIQKRENYVSFIFCGSDVLLTSCLEQRRESQMFQTLQYLEVGHMNRADIRAIFDMQSKKYDAYFSPDAVDAIWEYTHGLVWYAKLIGFIILHNIMSNDLTVRKNINRVDVSTAVQMLINGEIGTDKYDLLDATLSTERSAILHALAEIMPDFNMEVSVEEILSSIKMLQIEGYTDRRNGEKIPDIDEMKLRKELEFLVKMQFITSNESKTKYSFVAELYRLFFRKEKKMHLFEERRD